MFNLMQAVGAVFITFFLDSERIGGRRTRGLVSIAVMGTLTVATWIGLVVWLYRHPVAQYGATGPLWDWTDDEFGGFFVLDLLLGINMVIVSLPESLFKPAIIPPSLPPSLSPLSPQNHHPYTPTPADSLQTVPSRSSMDRIRAVQRPRASRPLRRLRERLFGRRSGSRLRHRSRGPDTTPGHGVHVQHPGDWAGEHARCDVGLRQAY